MATEFDKLIKWSEADFKWEEAKGDSPYIDHTGKEYYTWEDAFLVIEIGTTIEGGSSSIADVLETLPKEKKKRCIKLVMHYKGVKVYDEEKCIKNIKAYAKDVKIIAEDLKSKIIVKI